MVFCRAVHSYFKRRGSGKSNPEIVSKWNSGNKGDFFTEFWNTCKKTGMTPEQYFDSLECACLRRFVEERRNLIKYAWLSFDDIVKFYHGRRDHAERIVLRKIKLGLWRANPDDPANRALTQYKTWASEFEHWEKEVTREMSMDARCELNVTQAREMLQQGGLANTAFQQMPFGVPAGPRGTPPALPAGPSGHSRGFSRWLSTPLGRV